MKKPLVIIFGPCAAGKSTLGRALLAPEGDVQQSTRTFHVRTCNRANQLQPPSDELAPYCINSKTGWAMAGSLTAGSDAVRARATLTALTAYLLTQPEVKACIVNSVRFSQTADIFDHRGALRYVPFYVWLNLSLEENVRRLNARRGTSTLDIKSLENLNRFYKRAARNAALVREHFPAQLLELHDLDTPAGGRGKLLRSLAAYGYTFR